MKKQNHITGLLIFILFLFSFLLVEGEYKKAEARSSRRYRRTNPYTQIANKMKRSIKRVTNKIKRELVTSGYKMQDAVMDAGVALKAKITGKKPKRVWVQGHYKKGDKNPTSGHWKRVKHRRSRSGSGSESRISNTVPEGFDPTPTPDSPESNLAGGSSLPPSDPVLPAMSKSKKYSRRK